jgi:membrane protease YdiL (CAAX protease family)
MVAARIVGAVLAYLLALFSASILLYLLGLAIVPGPAEGTFALVALGLAEAIALGVVVLIWRYVDRRPVRALGLYRPGALPRWLRGAGVAALLMGFIVAINYVLIAGALVSVNPDPARATIVLLGGLLGFAIQGPAEEILFRGYILENLRGQWGLRWALVGSSIGFGLLHAPNPGFGPLPFLNLVLFGLATALYKVRLDNNRLWGVFGIHTTWNWLQQVVFGLPNSGMATIPDNALFTIVPGASVPDVLSGGGFGPEGTLAATLVLLALIGATLRRPARTAQRATS